MPITKEVKEAPAKGTGVDVGCEGFKGHAPSQPLQVKQLSRKTLSPTVPDIAVRPDGMETDQRSRVSDWGTLRRPFSSGGRGEGWGRDCGKGSERRYRSHSRSLAEK